MKLLEKLFSLLHSGDDLKTQLFAFLGSGEEEFRTITGKRLSREEVRHLLQEMIPAEIEMRGVCAQPVAMVVSAPHVSFDNWSEYFCNRVAKHFRTGWVVAKNYRDQDPHTIPIAIGRHIHVNRPLESRRPGGEEFHTARAEQVFTGYLDALKRASGQNALPLDALVEFHSQQRTPDFEVATVNVSEMLAQQLLDCYEISRRKYPRLPEFLIEPLHTVHLKATGTKQSGSLQSAVARCALHIEIPRELRRTDEDRRMACKAVFSLMEVLLENLLFEKNNTKT